MSDKEDTKQWVLLDISDTNNISKVGDFNEIIIQGTGGNWVLNDGNIVRITISDNPNSSNQPKKSFITNLLFEAPINRID